MLLREIDGGGRVEKGVRQEIDQQEWADETQVSFLSPVLSRLYGYWDDRRGAAAMPARADIDPIQFHYALGIVMLVDVLPGTPSGYRIRLHGTELAWRSGKDMTGRTFDELPASDLRILARQSFDAVVNERRPRRSERLRVLDARLRHYESLILPLGADRSTVDMLLIGLVYHQSGSGV